MYEGNAMGGAQQQEIRVFRRFVRYMRPYLPHVVATLVSTSLFVAFSSAAYWLSASFVTTLFSGSLDPNVDTSTLNGLLKSWTNWLLLGDSTHETLFRSALAIVVSFTLKNFFSYMQLFYVSHVEQGVIKDIRDELFGHLMGQDLAFYQRENRGDLLSTVLNDVEQLNQALNKSFTKLIRDPINALTVLVLLFAVSWKLTLAAVVVVPAVGWTVQVLAKLIKKHAVRVQELLARMTDHLQETISGIRIVKAFVNEEREVSRFSRTTGQHFDSAFAREKLRRMVIPLNEVVGVLIISAILFVGGEQVLVTGAINSEDFIRFLVLLFALLNPLLSLGNITTNIKIADAAGTRVFRVLDTRSDLPLAPAPGHVKRFEHKIRFENVSYRYTNDAPHVLHAINLAVPRGESLAIVGHSGSGKTTLMNMLPRFFDPTEGRISFDGKDLRELDLHDLRARFGMVTQQVILFHDTVAANIAYGLSGVPFERVEAAAKAAHADEFIRQLPEGYNTIVGEQGSLLSGGQRQRLSIARALLRDPEIVLLDEATSALDPESEEAVNAALHTLSTGRTVITVTHRLAAAMNADRIVVLEDGRIVATGKHNELIASSPVYHDLALRQKLVAGPEAPSEPK